MITLNKFILIIASLVLQTQAYQNAAQDACLLILKSECDSDCMGTIQKECLVKGAKPYDEGQCKYFVDNQNKYNGGNANKLWTEKYGVEFHGCFNLCEKEVSGKVKSYVQDYKKCTAFRVEFLWTLLVLIISLILL